MSDAQVISLAERLKQRREELGLSQAQAARELDVARTAYRLWEMEAASPHPDRWRLISRWLGVSITTMLLAEELDDEEDSTGSVDLVSESFERVGRDWEQPLSDPLEFFERVRKVVAEGAEKGFLSIDHAQELLEVVGRIEVERVAAESVAWEPTTLAKELTADASALRAAREAVAFVAADLQTQVVADAQVLTSELVTSSIEHAPSKLSKLGVTIDISRERLRVDVIDTGEHPRQLRADQDTGGYGQTLMDTLASRWQTAPEAGGTLTWFEIDLTQPGAQPQRR